MDIVSINNFEGPLDLLLHLIKKANINIWDINIDDITKQYLEYINKMEELNLDIASEYLTMAAELIEIKSSSLLPKNEDEENEEEDPKERLINRLLEYEQYKKLTSTFKELESYRCEVYTKEADNLSEFIDSDTNIDYGFDLNDLMNALTNVLSKEELSKPLDTKITNKEYSIKKRSKEIRSIIKKKKKVNFKELFDVYSKDYIIITFLSILSLTKNKEIIIEQDYNFKDIIIKDVKS